VVGKDVVESCGGRVELVEFVDGKSTTNIIEKILKNYAG
jgi:D-beta-D-heptose 7-phosphate kinase/D-beta-D-heptose 1-phosphate adenosyltransferase